MSVNNLLTATEIHRIDGEQSTSVRPKRSRKMYELYKSQSLKQSLTPPETPPHLKSDSLVHTWPEPETVPEQMIRSKRRKIDNTKTLEVTNEVPFDLPHQEVLLLHGPKQKYVYTKDQPIPTIRDAREMLVGVEAIGLNPIDWKAPDFGFGLPNLPAIAGRDLAGKVVIAPKTGSRFKKGDNVMAVSTDYRDSRKSAYQQYAVVPDFNACKIPSNVSVKEAAPLGVAFVAAALGLGICMGMDFIVAKGGPRGPNLLRIIRALSRDALPQDIRAECFDGIEQSQGAKSGDWIAIWGGSSASGCIAIQLAKLAGLKVIAIVDLERSGERMLKYGADLLVDRYDPERAIAIVKGVTKGKLRFGLDTRGKESAKLLAQAMVDPGDGTKAHLVGLTGLPKEPTAGVVYHTVPIKAFHEAPQVGESLMIWLERLLEQELFATLDIEFAKGGLEGINAALDKLRDGTVNGPRIVVPLKI